MENKSNEKKGNCSDGLPSVEAVVRIPPERLRPFPDHPFKVRDDEVMRETVESVRTYGVLAPAIVRPVEDGYEIISGHRRCRACDLAGPPDMPAIVRDMDGDPLSYYQNGPGSWSLTLWEMLEKIDRIW